MNGDLQLKLQAWVDGELTGEDVRRMESLIAADREAAALTGELRMTRTMLSGNEPERTVPASREFYWSRIRREIERTETSEAATATRPSFWSTFRRVLVPASGLALVVLVATLSAKYFGPASLEDAVQMIEVENLSPEMASMSHRSYEAKMFFVHVYAKDRAASEDDAPSESIDDLLFQ